MINTKSPYRPGRSNRYPIALPEYLLQFKKGFFHPIVHPFSCYRVFLFQARKLIGSQGYLSILHERSLVNAAILKVMYQLKKILDFETRKENKLKLTINRADLALFLAFSSIETFDKIVQVVNVLQRLLNLDWRV